MKKLFEIFLSLSIVLISSCRQENKQILVIPGLGLIVDNDTIKLGKTSDSEIFKIFKIKDTLIEADIGTACGYNTDGSWYHLIHIIKTLITTE